MAKKRPTHKNIKQGQTLYFINRHYERGWNAVPTVDTVFLYSHKEPLPPSSYIIERMPVSAMRENLKRLGNRNIFFSRKKALRECILLTAPEGKIFYLDLRYKG